MSTSSILKYLEHLPATLINRQFNKIIISFLVFKDTNKIGSTSEIILSVIRAQLPF